MKKSTQQLLLDGVSRADDMRRFKAHIPSRSCLIARIESAPEAPSEASRAILSLLREPMSIQELMDHFRIGDFRLYQRVYHLIEDGFASVIALEEERDRRITVGELVAFYNNAFQLVHSFVSELGHDDSLVSGMETFQQFYGFRELFDGVAFNEFGQLNPERLLENLRIQERPEPLFFLGQALSELLYFQLFGARGKLNETQRAQLRVVYDELAQLIA